MSTITQWGFYLKWCEQEKLDPYNRTNLEHFTNGTLYEDDYGTLYLDSDVEWSDKYGCYFDVNDTDTPRNALIHVWG